MIHLNRAFAILIGLSICTTLLADLVPRAGIVYVATVLVLSMVKARVILSQYLGLAQAPTFRRGFNAIVTIFVLAAFGLYLLPLAL